MARMERKYKNHVSQGRKDRLDVCFSPFITEKRDGIVITIFVIDVYGVEFLPESDNLSR